MTRRKQALTAAAALPAGERIPDALLFAEGLDPTDTFIGALVQAAPAHEDRHNSEGICGCSRCAERADRGEF